MPGLRLAADKRGKKTAPKKTAPEDWLGSVQPEETFEDDLEDDPLLMPPPAPSGAPVAIHASPPVDESADVAQMKEMIAQLQAQVNANTASRLQQTPQGTLAVTPYQVRVSCESCVKTIT